MASGLSKRKMSTAAGVRAMTTAAMVAAAGPKVRRTVSQSRTTVATPANACGSRTLHELRPNSRTDRPMTHRARGGLSIVMKLAASNEPKNQADQLFEAASAAAA